MDNQVKLQLISGGNVQVQSLTATSGSKYETASPALNKANVMNDSSEASEVYESSEVREASGSSVTGQVNGSSVMGQVNGSSVIILQDGSSVESQVNELSVCV